MDDNLKIKLYLDLREDGIVQPNGTYSTQNYTDYFININLNKKTKIIDEYIDVQKDPTRVDMQRQLINPSFIEYGFFESIRTTGISGTSSNNYNILVPSTENIIKKAEIFSITINK